MTVNCPSCGNSIASDDRFCGECGQRLMIDESPPEESRADEQQDRDYVTLLFQGFKRYFLEQDDFSAIEEAKALFRKAIEIDKERPEAFIGLGLCFFSLGEDEGGLSLIDEGLNKGFGADPRYEQITFDHNPDDQEDSEPMVFELDIETVIMYRATMHLNLGHLNFAMRDIQGVFDTIPDHYEPEKFAVRAEIYLKRGEYDRAREDAEQAVSLDPENVYAQTVLGRLDLLCGKPDVAILALSIALEIEPDSPEALLARAQAFHATRSEDLRDVDLYALQAIIDQGFSDKGLIEEMNRFLTAIGS